MATNRKRKVIVEENLPDDTGAGGENGVDVADVICVMSKVYRLNGGSKSFVTQTDIPVDEIFLQNNYPQGGKYIVYEFNTLGAQINTVNYEIEPKALTTSNGNNGHVGMGTVQEMQVRMLFDELSHSRQMVLQLIGQLAGSNRGGSVNELVTALASLHQISGGTQGKDPVELLIKGMELGANGGKVSGDWKSELLSTIKDVAPSALNAIAASRQPVAALNPAPGVNQSMTEQPTEEMLVRSYIQQIKTYAVGGLNVDLAVEWITNNARDPQYQPLLRLAIHGTVDNFIALDADIANEPYRAWFTSAITKIKEWYAEQQVPNDDDMDGGVGDDTNNKHDETVSVRRSNVTKIV